jgi:hypothetical protein
MPTPMMATSTAAGSPPNRSKTRALITSLKSNPHPDIGIGGLINQIIRIRPEKKNNQTQRLGRAGNNQRSLYSIS